MILYVIFPIILLLISMLLYNLSHKKKNSLIIKHKAASIYLTSYNKKQNSKKQNKLKTHRRMQLHSNLELNKI